MMTSLIVENLTTRSWISKSTKKWHRPILQIWQLGLMMHLDPCCIDDSTERVSGSLLTWLMSPNGLQLIRWPANIHTMGIMVQDYQLQFNSPQQWFGHSLLKICLIIAAQLKSRQCKVLWKLFSSFIFWLNFTLAKLGILGISYFPLKWLLKTSQKSVADSSLSLLGLSEIVNKTLQYVKVM